MSPIHRQLGGLLLTIVLVVSPCWARDEPSLRSDIPGGPLAGALKDLSDQTNLQLIYESGLVDGQTSCPVPAGTRARAALARLLRASGLRIVELNRRTLKIIPALPGRQPPGCQEAVAAEGALEEVLVTASRRIEPLGRVPLNVTVWSGADLERSGFRDVAQLAAVTPDFVYAFRTNTGGDLYSDSSLRGVSNRHSATVAVYEDDVQILPLRVGSYLRSYPALLDLDRVEIINGPQGALYGDYAQGGAIHLVTQQPSLTESTSDVHAEVGTRAGEPTYAADGVFGMPLVSGSAGIRIAADYAYEGGYVDRVNGQTGAVVDGHANASREGAARITATFRPRDNLELTPSISYQVVDVDDASTFALAVSNPDSGVYRDDTPQARPVHDAMTLSSLRAALQLGGYELSALAAHVDQRADAELSWTGPQLTDILENGFIDPGSGWRERLQQQTDSGELRLNSLGFHGRFAGFTGFAVSDSRGTDQVYVHVMGSTEAPIGLQTRHRQAAWFGQLEGEITSRLDLTAGVRVGWTDFSATTQGTPFEVSQDVRGLWYTPRLVLVFQADEEQTYFASASKGYGSPGVYPSIPLAYPTLFPRDEIWGYELGYKANALNERLRVASSLFYLNWNNGPATDTALIAESTPAPGAAHSEGMDLSVKAALPRELTLEFAGALTRAVYQHPNAPPDLFLVRQGDASAQSPGIASISLTQSFSLAEGVRASWRLADVYDSGVATQYYLTNPSSTFALKRETHGAGHRVAVRTEAQWPTFSLGIFVTNALNSHPLRETDFFNAPSYAQTYPPRTVGVSGTWSNR